MYFHIRIPLNLLSQIELNRCKSDKEFKEERMMRQLQYLDEQNKQLKKDVSVSMNKYFDEKKKWQTKQRELEEKLSEMSKMRSATDPAPPTDKSEYENTHTYIHAYVHSTYYTKENAIEIHTYTHMHSHASVHTYIHIQT